MLKWYDIKVMRMNTVARAGKMASGLAGVSVLGLLGFGLAGCGLLDLDSFRGITFDLPEKSYNVDTSDPKWDGPPEGGLPAVPCGPGGIASCCEPPAPLVVDCQMYPLICESGACAYQFTYEVESLIDLKKEVPQLSSGAGDALSEILLKNIKVTLNNGLNRSLPPVEVFVAPQDATSASDSRARKLATMPGKAAGYQGTEVLPVDAAGQAAFSQFATNYQVPFKIIARTKLSVRSGDPAPSGRATARIGGQVEAQI